MTHTSLCEYLARPTDSRGTVPERRLLALCDPGSLVPLRSGWRSPLGVAAARGRGGAVAAHALVDGRPIVCYAMDPAVAGGAIGADDAHLVVRALDRAGADRVPVVFFVESAGARLQDGVAALEGCARLLRAHAALSGHVPQVSVVCGKSAGAGAYAPALSDIVVMTDRAAMFLTGPRVVRAAIGEEVDAARLGGPRVHRGNGVCHAGVRDDTEAAVLARRILAHLPQCAGAPTPRTIAAPPARRDLAACLPASGRRCYDVRAVIAGLVDHGEALEISPFWGRSLLTAFARLGGRTVGLVASQPTHLGGLLDADAAQKGARFVRTCDTFALPLVVLVDTPGFMPGRKQETCGVLRHGADLLRAFATARVPRVTVILRKAYGGAFIAMNSRGLGADLTCAWPRAEIGIMSPDAAAVALREPTTAVTEQRMAASAAAHDGFVDEVVAPNDTPTRLRRFIDDCAPQRTRAARGRVAATRRRPSSFLAPKTSEVPR